MLHRRELIGIAARAGASLALAPKLLRALQQPGGELIQRAIPSSGEMLPVIGLGFANHPSCADPAALKQVLRTFFDNGGRVFDTLQASAASEQFHATVANELGIQDELFLGLQGLPASGGAPQPKEPDPAIEEAQLESLLARFKVTRLDLVHLPLTADPGYWGVLKEAKKEGRIRYIGASGPSFAPFPQFEAIMRNEPIDFISVDYSVEGRGAEEAILPLALERKIGVMAHFPFGGAGGLSCTGDAGLFGRVGTTPLPDWAAEFDATTWAQFFLKYVVSHPAITVVRAGTTKAHHMLENIGGGIGRLPDEATRRRMVELVDSWPWARRAAGSPPHVPKASAVTLPAAILDRYVGEYTTASGVTMSFRRDGTTLFAKPASNPEAPLAASSETRFSDPRGPFIEFQLDRDGKVTGLVLEQGNPTQKIPASRIR